MNPELDHLQHRLVAALSAQVVPGTGLRDPHSGRPTPPDHYGHTGAALALAAHDATLWPMACEALRAWLALDARRVGHLPFNRLLLWLLDDVARELDVAAADRRLIRDGLSRCTIDSRYPSNNWTLLAQTCRLVEATGHRRAAECDRLCTLIERWTTRAGAFIDFPARPGRRFATPIAYHHKALFLTALAAWFHDDARLAAHAQRLLDWLVHCWDPAGYAGGIGRSNHALFGDGCLLGALILLGHDTDDPQSPVAALARRLERQRRPDGLLWLDPAGPDSGDASWDGYMHLSVYNAWTAAVIAATRRLRRRAVPGGPRSPAPWNAARTGCFHDDEAGILYLRTASGLNALIATHGQPPQSFSRDEIDLRYAGGVIAHLSHGGEPVVPAPVRIARESLLATPALAGWTPVLQHDGELFALTDFDRVSIAPRDDGVTVRFEGHPAALLRQAPRSPFARMLAALDWRLLGGRLGRRASLDRPRDRTILGRLRLDVGEPATVSVELEIDATGATDVRYLNPRGHALVAPAREADAAQEVALPASLARAAGRCAAPERLDGERRRWAFGLPLAAANAPAPARTPDPAIDCPGQAPCYEPPHENDRGEC